MRIKKVELTNFRSFKQARFKFAPDLTVLVGPNASGKSNLLEAIYYLAYAVSPRTRLGRELIRWGEQQALIRGQVVSDERASVKNLAVIVKPENRTLLINQKEQRFSDFWGQFRLVQFSPADLALIEGSPRHRRRFLDLTLYNLNQSYLLWLSEYRQALKNRNQLLRQGLAAIDQLEVWEEGLSQVGARVLIERGRLVREINEALCRKKIELKIEYLPSPRCASEFLDDQTQLDQPALAGILREKMRELRKKERALGYSLVGPQRDDFRLKQAGVNLNQFGSRGEQRMVVVWLKMTQLELLTEKIEQPLVLLLDDVFSELDMMNQSRLEKILPHHQTVLTATDLSKLPHSLRQATQIQLN